MLFCSKSKLIYQYNISFNTSLPIEIFFRIIWKMLLDLLIIQKMKKLYHS